MGSHLGGSVDQHVQPHQEGSGLLGEAALVIHRGQQRQVVLQTREIILLNGMCEEVGDGSLINEVLWVENVYIQWVYADESNTYMRDNQYEIVIFHCVTRSIAEYTVR